MGWLAWIFGELAEPRLDVSVLATAFEEISQGVLKETERIRREKERVCKDAERSSSARTERGQAAWQNADVRFSVRSTREAGPKANPSQAFGSLLMKAVREKCGGRASDCYRRAGISRQLYSRIVSDPKKGVDRKTVMRLAIGLKLDMPEAQKFLASAGYAFRPSDYGDMVFAWCIEHGAYSIFDVNELLLRGHCPPLTIC